MHEQCSTAGGKWPARCATLAPEPFRATLLQIDRAAIFEKSCHAISLTHIPHLRLSAPREVSYPSIA
jgi:hypothetical protein